MPNNFEGNIFLTFFVKHKIEWDSFKSSDSAFHNLGPMNFIVFLRTLACSSCKMYKHTEKRSVYYMMIFINIIVFFPAQISICVLKTTAAVTWTPSVPRWATLKSSVNVALASREMDSHAQVSITFIHINFAVISRQKANLNGIKQYNKTKF